MNKQFFTTFVAVNLGVLSASLLVHMMRTKALGETAASVGEKIAAGFAG